MSLRILSALALGLATFCSGMASAAPLQTLDDAGKVNGAWNIECSYGVTTEATTLKDSQYRSVFIPKGAAPAATGGEREVGNIFAGVCPRTIDSMAQSTTERGNNVLGSASVPEILYLTDFVTRPTYLGRGNPRYATTCNYEALHSSPGTKGFGTFMPQSNSDKKTCTVTLKSETQL